MQFLVTVAVLLSAPPSGGAAARRAEATAALQAAERARGAEVLEDPLALVAAGWTAEANLAFFARAAQLVSDGRRALARVELEKAEQLFGEADRVYRLEDERPGVTAEWAEAAKWRGVALFELKRRDEAAAAWALAKQLDGDVQLTEAMVRPEVARAFAAVPAPREHGVPSYQDGEHAFVERPPGDVARVETLGVDDVVVAAVAVDGGALTYAATRARARCATEVLTSTSAGELVRRLDEAPCRKGAPPDVLAAPAIAHPRPAPAVAIAPAARPIDRRARWWKKPWLWVGVVGAVAVGVVVGVSVWPREPSYSAVADFHSFALGGR